MGASTITQQVAKNFLLSSEQSMERKIKEAMTAIKLERSYSKDEILEMYLNQHYFSRGAYGVSAAARLFFDKKVPELNVSDCAILIGLLKGPNINSPLNNRVKARQARNRVLSSYYHFGQLTRAEFDSLTEAPLVISPPEEDPGIAPYFTETVRRRLHESYGSSSLYRGGLEVRTTLDSRLQRIAAEAVEIRFNTRNSASLNLLNSMPN